MFYSMNPVVKEKWLAALRSDNYTQTSGKLRINDSFCCLGVLCDLYSKETGNEWEGYNYSFKFLGSTGVLPWKVCDWANLRDEGALLNEEGNSSLWSLNDSGKTFEEIADVIEKEL